MCLLKATISKVLVQDFSIGIVLVALRERDSVEPSFTISYDNLCMLWACRLEREKESRQCPIQSTFCQTLVPLSFTDDLHFCFDVNFLNSQALEDKCKFYPSE